MNKLHLFAKATRAAVFKTKMRLRERERGKRAKRPALSSVAQLVADAAARVPMLRSRAISARGTPRKRRGGAARSIERRGASRRAAACCGRAAGMSAGKALPCAQRVVSQEEGEDPLPQLSSCDNAFIPL